MFVGRVYTLECSKKEGEWTSEVKREMTDHVLVLGCPF